MPQIKFCKVDELPPGKSIEKKILARKLVVFNDNEEIIAMESECKHMKAPLDFSKAVNGVITCDWHQWKYNVKSGKCLNQENMDLKQFETEIIDGYIFVNFGV